MFDFLTNRFSSLFNSLVGSSKLTESNVGDVIVKIQESLLEADVQQQLVSDFIARVKKEALGEKVLKSLKPGEQFIKVVYEQLVMFLTGSAKQLELPRQGIVVVMGLQGSGKTTTLAKLAHHTIATSRKRQPKILLASVDFYRPAAIDQLEVLASQVGCGFYRSSQKNVSDAVVDIIQHKKNGGYDLLFLDTAGRLQVDDSMMEELKHVIAKLTSPIKLLVLDAMTGQQSLSVAKKFNEAVGFDGAVLSKMDSDTRGGAAFSFGYTLNKPIWFVGTGEHLNELEQFKPDRMATRILGMGDLQTLLEKAERDIEQADQAVLEKSLRSGKFTLQDFERQMSMMDKLGSLSSMVKYLPGMGGLGKLSPEMIEQGEHEMKKFKAIIRSMTPGERQNHGLINDSRKTRIARGAGVQVKDIGLLLKRFEESRQFVKLLSNGNMRRFFR
jgi:signal recognition particle subunit SRP54